MTESITPPPNLVQQWDYEGTAMFCPEYQQHLTARAAQWGADMELEACCEWLVSAVWFRYEHEAVQELRAARRPKPPSLKEQAFKILNPEKEGVLCGTFEYRVSTSEAATIRRALEALPDD